MIEKVIFDTHTHLVSDDDVEEERSEEYFKEPNTNLYIKNENRKLSKMSPPGSPNISLCII